MKHRSLSMVMFLLIVSLLMGARAPAAAPAPQKPAEPAAPAKPTEPAAPGVLSGEQVLRLATTTSTADSGLLDAILPDFQAKFNARVDVVAVDPARPLRSAPRVTPMCCWSMRASPRTNLWPTVTLKSASM